MLLFAFSFHILQENDKYKSDACLYLIKLVICRPMICFAVRFKFLSTRCFRMHNIPSSSRQSCANTLTPSKIILSKVVFKIGK